MSPASRIHTPRYASQPTGRRSLSENQRVIESVLPDEVVAQIRNTSFDEMLNNGFSSTFFFKKSRHIVSTLKLSLTPSNANDFAYPTRRSSRFNF
ncbi:hypothetical protein DSO57_1003488 [Entomophthora muscae]|uniref:Uncharacterized protein n=1 Tax=Entomophthora muscae TaxID=34485 RepID=A0ACC2RNK4_9FUNG|nr:hypothetical protein DSO57_1003488 [Entomophthora muscae]